MHRTRSAPVSLALNTVLGMVAGVFFVLSVTSGSNLTAQPQRATGIQLQVDRTGDQLQQMMSRHGCSTSGMADGIVPTEALVRDARGRVRLVSFAKGWAVYAGQRPGTLVAVCSGRDDHPA